MIYFDDFKKNAVVAPISNVLNSFDGRNDHTDQGRNSMAKGLIFYVQNFQQKLKVFIVGDLKNIPANQLLHQTFPQLRGYLKGINS